MSIRLTRAHSFLKENHFFLVVYLLAISAIIVGFIYSRALLSIGQIVLSINWLLEGDLSGKIGRLKKNKEALILSGLYVVHLLFLFNTNNFEYAIEDIRIKLPLLLFPIIFASTEILDLRAFKATLFLFVATVFSSTVVISLNYMFHSNEIDDLREASFLISHIRLALMICLSISIALYYSAKINRTGAIFLVILSVWFTFYMFYFAYLTGLGILACVLLFMFVWYLRKSSISRAVKYGILAILLVIFSSISIYTSITARDYYKDNKAKNIPDLKRTDQNNYYYQWYTEDSYNIRENGYLVFQNLSLSELEVEWNKRSDFKIDYSDKEHPELEDILLRFLASKGLPKDANSIHSLRKEEILAIESGITNVKFLGKSGMYKRLYNVFWQYDIYMNGVNFNGHSIGMRLEFWKTGISVFQRHFFFGTGTGDIEDAFQEQYILDNSKLTSEWRFRSHNQIISIAATFGVFGLIYFIIVLIIPIFRAKNMFMYLCFSLIFFLSILTEDTLETQIGVTFYAFFTSFLFFQNRPLKD